MGRDAGRPEDPADYAQRPGRFQGRSLSGGRHHTMVHSRDRRLQRVHQGKVGWIINITTMEAVQERQLGLPPPADLVWAIFSVSSSLLARAIIDIR